MKVKDLLKKLEKIDPEMEIYSYQNIDGDIFLEKYNNYDIGNFVIMKYYSNLYYENVWEKADNINNIFNIDILNAKEVFIL
jgi:hypothetical protein